MAIPPKLPLTVTTLYAELLDLSERDDVLGYTIGHYTKKKIKGKVYWYLQRTIGKKRTQKYIGPETPDLLNEINIRKEQNRDRNEEFRRRREIRRALGAGARLNMDSTTGKILKALSEAGAFSAGAILVGSHAYAIYAPMLGRTFIEAHTRTGDVDFAAIQIAVDEPVSFSDVIRAAEEGMLLVPPAPHSRIATKLKMRGSDYRIELLTPGESEGQAPVVIPNLKFGAQPLPYLDFLIEDPIDAVAPVDVGIRVKVPAPERYALHKLIVAQARHRSQFAKREKDLLQARELLSVLREDLPAELAQAWRSLEEKGSEYTSRAEASLAVLDISKRDVLGASLDGPR